MNKSFDFYFDFISPYAFIAHNKIKKIEKEYMFKINYQPILLGGLHNLHEIKAPAFIPSKAKFMIRDCKMVAEKNKINKQSLMYINRLSDFLFVVSRTTNDNGKADILWVPGENQ